MVLSRLAVPVERADDSRHVRAVTVVVVEVTVFLREEPVQAPEMPAPNDVQIGVAPVAR